MKIGILVLSIAFNHVIRIETMYAKLGSRLGYSYILIYEPGGSTVVPVTNN